MTEREIIRDEIVMRMGCIKPYIMENEGSLIAYTAYSKIRDFIDNMIPQPSALELANISTDAMVSEYIGRNFFPYTTPEEPFMIQAYREGVEDTLKKLRKGLPSNSLFAKIEAGIREMEKEAESIRKKNYEQGSKTGIESVVSKRLNRLRGEWFELEEETEGMVNELLSLIFSAPQEPVNDDLEKEKFIKRELGFIRGYREKAIKELEKLEGQKPASDDLEKEIKDIQQDYKENGCNLDGDIDFIARHFANWQKKQMITKACEWLRRTQPQAILPDTTIERFKNAMEE